MQMYNMGCFVSERQASFIHPTDPGPPQAMYTILVNNLLTRILSVVSSCICTTGAAACATAYPRNRASPSAPASTSKVKVSHLSHGVALCLDFFPIASAFCSFSHSNCTVSSHKSLVGCRQLTSFTTKHRQTPPSMLLLQIC